MADLTKDELDEIEARCNGLEARGEELDAENAKLQEMVLDGYKRAEKAEARVRELENELRMVRSHLWDEVIKGREAIRETQRGGEAVKVTLEPGQKVLVSATIVRRLSDNLPEEQRGWEVRTSRGTLYVSPGEFWVKSDSPPGIGQAEVSNKEEKPQ